MPKKRDFLETTDAESAAEVSEFAARLGLGAISAADAAKIAANAKSMMERGRGWHGASKATGSGIVWEVIQARDLTKQEMADEMGVGLSMVKRYCTNGTYPTRNADARAKILSAALLVPADERSPELAEWIESEREYWRNIAPPGVFL